MIVILQSVLEIAMQVLLVINDGYRANMELTDGHQPRWNILNCLESSFIGLIDFTITRVTEEVAKCP